MGKLFREFNDEKWEQVRTDPYFAPHVAAIRQRAANYLKSEPPRIKFSDIHLFVTTGDRSKFQSVYFNYQSRMEHYFFMLLLDNDESYIEPLADIIWNICDFESWSIPAHISEDAPEERRKTSLDLCSTILSFTIAEVLYYVGDRLPALVYKRAKHEIRYRLIESYAKNDDYGWMRVKSNWASVCIGATLCAYLYAAEKEEIDAQIPRMIETARCYLAGFDDEGCCMEGYSYWNYGFSYFCLFASMLRDYTDGDIDLFKDPKVHQIALFQQCIAINDKQSICFSDCPTTFTPANWLSHFLKNEYPDIEIPSIPPSTSGARLRYILWQDPSLANCEMHPKSKIFHEAQWFIYRGDKYNFACKAGHNAEQHNHNDVGSFLISKNGKVTFCDPGSGEYTRQYFSSERYTLLACSSRGHSVPIINGEYQVAGNNKSTVFTETDKSYAFSMENAYSIPSLSSLRRAFTMEDDGIALVDTYEFTEKPNGVTERFVSLTKPEPDGEGRVRCGDSTLLFDASKLELSIGSETIVRSPTLSEQVWLVDLKVKAPELKFDISVSFR